MRNLTIEGTRDSDSWSSDGSMDCIGSAADIHNEVGVVEAGMDTAGASCAQPLPRTIRFSNDDKLQDGWYIPPVDTTCGTRLVAGSSSERRREWCYWHVRFAMTSLETCIIQVYSFLQLDRDGNRRQF